MLTLSRHTTINIEQLNQSADYAPVMISLGYHLNTQVQVMAGYNGSASWLNPATRKREHFRSLADARQEITLNLLGLKKRVQPISYRGARVEIFSSVLSQQPEQVQDFFKAEDGYLVHELEYIYSFRFGSSTDGDPIWFSSTDYNDIRQQLVNAIDADLDGCGDLLQKNSCIVIDAA